MQTATEFAERARELANRSKTNVEEKRQAYLTLLNGQPASQEGESDEVFNARLKLQDAIEENDYLQERADRAEKAAR